MSVHSDSTTSAAARQKRLRQRATVGLLSANPFALPHLHNLVRRSGLRIKHGKLNITTRTEMDDIRVPNASVYVLDACSTGLITEGVVAALRARHPRGRVIVVAVTMREEAAFSLLQLGVKGLVFEKEAEGSLARAVQAVNGGGVWIPRVLTARFIDHMLGRSTQEPTSAATARRLSQRERQVLDGVLKSQSNKEIAASLYISESTVKFHLTRLFNKFGVRRRADLILHSIQQPAMVH